MQTTKSDIKKALDISRTVQHYIEMTGETNLRSTDVFPQLVKKGLFEPDRHNGIHFRRFLYKLEKSGELKSLIPQCSQVKPLKGQIFSEWYFHCAKDKMPKSKKQEVNTKYQENNGSLNKSITPLQNEYTKMDIDEALDIVRMLIAGINPITERPQDNLGVCADITVTEALRTIIDPEAYNSNESALLEDKFDLTLYRHIHDGNRLNYISASALGRSIKRDYHHIIQIMKQKKYIIDKHNITKKGKSLGLKLRQNAKGQKWIVYPDYLSKLL